MSHVTTIKTEVKIKSLDLLEAACKLLGTVELVRDAKQHRYWGGKLDQCDHKIRVIGNNEAYEIGVVKQGDEFKLNADFFCGGRGLEGAVGGNAAKLLMTYSVAQSTQALQMQGFALTERRTLPNGSMQVVFEL